MNFEYPEIMRHNSFSELIWLSHNKLIVDDNGFLRSIPSPFQNDLDYEKFVDHVFAEAKIHCNVEKPFTHGRFREYRVQFCRGEIHHGSHTISFRKLQPMSWTLERLNDLDWCTPAQMRCLQEMISRRENFLVVGPTSSGKTTVLGTLIRAVSENERCLVLEDTDELGLPNEKSSKLLTRLDPNGSLPEIDLSELIRISLRLRPDRLVVGEVRGAEAMSLLVALSTGHAGSAGTLHAKDAKQALMRLEMLVQMGAPQWSTDLIRKLMLQTIQTVVVCGINNGKRKLQGIYRVFALESSGFILEQEC